MRHEKGCAPAGRRALAGTIALVMMLAPAGHAEVVAEPGGVSAVGGTPAAMTAAGLEAAWATQAAEPPGEIERWWGAAGAILCAAEVRLIVRVPAVGMNPYLLAAGIAGCTLALIDVFTTQ